LLVVTLVTKDGCTLCKKVEQLLSSVASGRNFKLELSSLGEDEELQSKYLLRIPVVIVDGVEVFEAKDMDLAGLWRDRLERILTGRTSA